MNKLSRIVMCSVAALALVVLSSTSKAHAGDYIDTIHSLEVAQGTNGTTYTVFLSGGFWWAIPATDPGFAAYTTLLTYAWQTGRKVQTGCASCSSFPLTVQTLNGSITVWNVQMVEVQ